jgi:hypothetical protein
MYAFIDNVGVGFAHQEHYAQWAALYFIAVIVVSALFLKFIFIGSCAHTEGRVCHHHQSLQLSSSNNLNVFVNSIPSGSAANNFCNSIVSISDYVYNSYDYVALSDQDDIWYINKLITAVDKLNNSNSSLYASNMLLWEENTGKEFIIKNL